MEPRSNKQTNKSPWLEPSTGTNGLVPQERQHRVQSSVLLKLTNFHLFSYPSTLKKSRKDSKKGAQLCRKTAGLWVGELLGRIDRPCSMSSSHPGITQDPSNAAAAAASHLLTSPGPLHTESDPCTSLHRRTECLKPEHWQSCLSSPWYTFVFKQEAVFSAEQGHNQINF